MEVKLLFSEYFDIKSSILQKYGAFDICIESDLPLFIDPFLLFASEKSEYQTLHDRIVSHLILLKDLATKDSKRDISIFLFPEIKQNWFGMCKYGNNGKGLGPKFARALIKSFNGYYNSFGTETILESAHIEKLTLVGKGIGKDFISDFTTNLILEYLLEYTEKFAKKYLKQNQCEVFDIRCKFNPDTEIWTSKKFTLPYFYKTNGDYIILTPSDILTKDEAYICSDDLYSRFKQIASSLENSQLREAINSFFRKRLPQKPKNIDIDAAITATLEQFPVLLDHYIKDRESTKANAAGISLEKVIRLKTELINTLEEFCRRISSTTDFFIINPTSYGEALRRVYFLKEVIENNDGYRIFYKNGFPIAKEDTIQRIFRLTWFATPYDVNSEVNNGRGSADYKISFGRNDSTIVEFKLGKSSSLKANLQHQVEIYKQASKSVSDISAILCYSRQEILRVQKVRKELKIQDAENIVIIDASPKKSASKVV